jgi:glycosyltransferase involved in cell wall biosynthesis
MPESLAVTILLPLKNDLAYVSECLKSLLDQDIGGSLMQLIVVDDHSTDGSIDLVKEILTNQNKINEWEVLKNKGNGISAAFRTGITKAKTETIIRFTFHLVAQPNTIKTLCETLWKLPDTVSAVCCSYRPYPSDNIFSRTAVATLISPYCSYGTSHSFTRHSGYVPYITACAAIRRNDLKDYPMGDDSALSYTIIMQGKKIYLTNETNIYYRYKRYGPLDHIRRMFSYGQSRARDITMFKSSYNVIYFIPSILTLVIAISILILFLPFESTIKLLAFISPLTYLVFVFINGLLISLQQQKLIILPYSIFMMASTHLSYGTGFAAYLLGFARRILDESVDS